MEPEKVDNETYTGLYGVFFSSLESIVQVHEEQQWKKSHFSCEAQSCIQSSAGILTMRFFLSTARPENITIVKVGMNVRFRIG